MHTWVVSQLCSQHDIMYVSELLKYTCSVCFIIYQVVVCACVQVIKVIKIVTCWTISFLVTIHSWFTRIILILRRWYYTCSHSSSPLAFITSIPFCCGTAVFHSVTLSLIYYLYDVEIRLQTWVDWQYKHVFLSGYYSLWHNYLLTHCYLLYNKWIWGVV